MVSPSWTVGIILASSCFRSQVSNFILSSASSKAPVLQQRQYTNILSNAVLLLLPIKVQLSVGQTLEELCKTRYSSHSAFFCHLRGIVLQEIEARAWIRWITDTHPFVNCRPQECLAIKLDLLRTHASNTRLQSRSVVSLT